MNWGTEMGDCGYAFRFGLHFNYVIHRMQRIISKKFITLPSKRLLRELKSKYLDSGKSLSKLREEDLIGNDVVLLLDDFQMYRKPYLSLN